MGDSRRHVWVRSRTDGIAKIGTLDCKADSRARRQLPVHAIILNFMVVRKRKRFVQYIHGLVWPAGSGPAPLQIRAFARTASDGYTLNVLSGEGHSVKKFGVADINRLHF